ncbi:MAG TPA: hypothetical protein DCL88_03850 [Gammaproteobacteria bacterium]|nr:hypothetical protein [Gammaproteobacteria bacterium]
MTSSISCGAAKAEPVASDVAMAAFAEITAALNFPRRNIKHPHELQAITIQTCAGNIKFA